VHARMEKEKRETILDLAYKWEVKGNERCKCNWSWNGKIWEIS
jgi:hypothetical protein